MAQVKIEDIVDHLDTEFKKALDDTMSQLLKLKISTEMNFSDSFVVGSISIAVSGRMYPTTQLKSESRFVTLGNCQIVAAGFVIADLRGVVFDDTLNHPVYDHGV